MAQTAIMIFLIAGFSLGGFKLGERHAFNQVADLAHSVEHQNAFGACLAERWRQGQK